MKGTLAGHFTSWQSTFAVDKAKSYADFTLPQLMLDPALVTGSNSPPCDRDYQSYGALLVNNLAAKLSAALFPPGRPNFKIKATDALVQEAAAQQLSKDDLDTLLSKVEREAYDKLFLNAANANIVLAFKLLIVTGQVMIYRDPSGALMVWSLRSFVTKRYPNGRLKAAILRQTDTYGNLPEEIRAAYEASNQGRMLKEHTKVDLYTKVEHEMGTPNGHYEVTHELDGIDVTPPNSGIYPEHLCPYIVPVWAVTPGEHYGRGLVEDYAGDFTKLSLLSEKLALYELESLDVLNLVAEGVAGGTIDEYQEAATGDYVNGGPNKISAYERGDYQKINAVRSSLNELKTELALAFMYQANTRNAERVTAYEIQTMAREMETTLGGVYSTFSENFQAPLAYLCMLDVSEHLLSGLISRDYKPTITTGIAALTRAADTRALIQTAQDMASIAPLIQMYQNSLDSIKVLNIVLRANGLEPSDVMLSPEQLQQQAQANNAQADQAGQVVQNISDIAATTAGALNG